MRNLLAQKKEIVEKHLPKVMEIRIKANLEILKLMTSALKDRKISAKVHMGILDKLKFGGQVGTDSSIEMDSEQRLEMVRMWFENAKASMDAIRDDVKLGYESYLKSIDEEMELCREEIRQIDKELKRVEEKDKRSKLLKERREHLKRAA
ncbi:MAG: hypothetical protein OEY95_03870 [Candidatus Bathyarchaeota archaeon]|nr:hypothetical protein [Candidatus Bathyarchaeota archaeon]